MNEIMSDMTSMVQWVEQLKDINVDNLEPLVSPIEVDAMMRQDIVKSAETQYDILRNAPKVESNFYVTPKSVE